MHKPKFHKTDIKFKRGTLEALNTLSFQNPYRSVTECKHCGKKAVLIGVIDDQAGELSKENPPVEAKHWPHDSCSIFVYLCGECLQVTGLFTQG